MVKTSFRFYLFSSLIVLNTLNFVGETFYMSFKGFLIVRSFIIITSAIIFSLTIVFMMRASLENLIEVKPRVRLITWLEYFVVSLGTVIIIILFIQNAIL